MPDHPDDPRLESPMGPDPWRAWTIAILCAAGVAPLRSQEGGVVAEFCSGGPACSDDTLEIVFESGTSTYEGPLEAGAYAMSMTHLFGTARMGSDPATSVVGLDFQHHDVAGLYVADSSVFPSNTGVNPQIPIMALAQLCAEGLLSSSSRKAA